MNIAKSVTQILNCEVEGQTLSKMQCLLSDFIKNNYFKDCRIFFIKIKNFTSFDNLQK